MVTSLPTATIFDIMRYSIKDGPGIRTTVFLKGCPLDCWWCHNPEGQAYNPELMFWEDRCVGCGGCLKTCPAGAVVAADGVAGSGMPHTVKEKCTLCGKCVEACYSGARVMVGRSMSPDELLSEISRDVVFYDQSGGGVTFSGGEPLAQPCFLAEMLHRCKEAGISTAVDTSGYCDRDILLDISRDADLFLYDIKLMDSARHRQYTGVSNEVILENLKSLSERHGNIVVRIPLIPGINDDEKNMAETGLFLSSLQNIAGVAVLPYHRTGAGKYARLHLPDRLLDAKEPTPDSAARVVDRLRAFGLKAGG